MWTFIIPGGDLCVIAVLLSILFYIKHFFKNKKWRAWKEGKLDQCCESVKCGNSGQREEVGVVPQANPGYLLARSRGWRSGQGPPAAASAKIRSGKVSKNRRPRTHFNQERHISSWSIFWHYLKLFLESLLFYTYTYIHTPSYVTIMAQDTQHNSNYILELQTYNSSHDAH